MNIKMCYPNKTIVKMHSKEFWWQSRVERNIFPNDFLHNGFSLGASFLIKFFRQFPSTASS